MLIVIIMIIKIIRVIIKKAMVIKEVHLFYLKN